MPEDPRPQFTLIRLREPFQVRGGALYSPGQTAAFEPWLAEALIKQRIADPVEPEAEGMVAPATRAYPEPPNHKMVTAAPFSKRKEERRGR